MSGYLAHILCLILSGALPAQADTVCPPTDMLAPMFDSRDVSIGEASVSTAQFPGSWQSGTIGQADYEYRLFVNGSGSIGSDAAMSAWRVDFECDLAKGSCAYYSNHAAPKLAIDIAKKIGNCLTSKSVPASSQTVNKQKPSAKAGKATKADPAKTEKPLKLAGSGASSQPKSMVANVVPNAAAPAKSIPPTGSPPASATQTKADPVAAVITAAASSDKPTEVVGGLSHDPTRQGNLQVATAKPSPKPISVNQKSPSHVYLYEQTDPKAKPLGGPPIVWPDVRLEWPKAKPRGDIAIKADCVVDRIPDEPPAMRTQRLLLLIGLDPGPIDGDAGLKTQTALRSIIGEKGRGASPEVINRQLRKIICHF